MWKFDLKKYINLFNEYFYINDNNKCFLNKNIDIDYASNIDNILIDIKQEDEYLINEIINSNIKNIDIMMPKNLLSNTICTFTTNNNKMSTKIYIKIATNENYNDIFTNYVLWDIMVYKKKYSILLNLFNFKFDQTIFKSLNTILKINYDNINDNLYLLTMCDNKYDYLSVRKYLLHLKKENEIEEFLIELLFQILITFAEIKLRYPFFNHGELNLDNIYVIKNLNPDNITYNYKNEEYNGNFIYTFKMYNFYKSWGILLKSEFEQVSNKNNKKDIEILINDITKVCNDKKNINLNTITNMNSLFTYISRYNDDNNLEWNILKHNEIFQKYKNKNIIIKKISTENLSNSPTLSIKKNKKYNKYIHMLKNINVLERVYKHFYKKGGRWNKKTASKKNKTWIKQNNEIETNINIDKNNFIKKAFNLNDNHIKNI